MASIQFLGAAGTVTGSRFLLEHLPACVASVESVA